MGPWPLNSGCFRSAAADFWSFSKIFTPVAIIAWLVTRWHYFLIRDASVVTPRVVGLKKYHMCVCFDFQRGIKTLDRSLTSGLTSWRGHSWFKSCPRNSVRLRSSLWNGKPWLLIQSIDICKLQIAICSTK